MSNYHNFSDEILVNDIFALDQEIKSLQKALDAAKAEFKKRGLKEFTTEVCTIKVTEEIRGTAMIADIKKFLGEDYFKFERPTVYNTMRIKAL